MAESAALRPAETDKRAQILEGARQVFFARGFDGASMSDIALAAGVSKGTLYVADFVWEFTKLRHSKDLIFYPKRR